MEKLDELIKAFSTLQGIGKKSAIRIAFDILNKSPEEINKFILSVKDAYYTIKPCEICMNLTDNKICDVCADENRDKKIVCIVENARDVIAIENTKMYNGLYHILGGKIDPLNGVRADDLNIDSLLKRLKNIKECILALNPDIEGETTSLYIIKILEEYNIKISKIASGIPMGWNIEYADMMTIVKSLEGRQVIKDE